MNYKFRPALRSYWQSWLSMLLFGYLAYRYSDKILPQNILDAIPEYHAYLLPGLVVIFYVMTVSIRRSNFLYEIENGDLIRCTVGTFSKMSREFSISDGIQTDIKISGMGSLLNYGEVSFWPGDDRSKLIWWNVARPKQLADTIARLRREITGRVKVKGEDGQEKVLLPPTKDQAWKSKKTGFGFIGENPVLTTESRKRIPTLNGSLIDNCDGTVTHEESKLMAIRAPWGMVWNGSEFMGNPIGLNWRTATAMFGEGCGAPYPLYYRDCSRLRENRKYKRGKCKISFAGFDDWRLATTDELVPFFPIKWFVQFEEVGVESGDPTAMEKWDAMKREQYPFLWNGRTLSPTLSRLYPAFSDRKFLLWTADYAGYNDCGWAFGDSDSSFVDVKVKNELELFFVRDYQGTEYIGRKTEDVPIKEFQPPTESQVE